MRSASLRSESTNAEEGLVLCRLQETPAAREQTILYNLFMSGAS